MATDRRRPATPLSRESIALAALRVVDRGGAPAFSIRAVASELGVSPMALYYHVADRTELITLMTEIGYREEPLATQPADDWRDELWAIARWFLGATQRHPALVVLSRDLATPPTMQRAGERWFAAWRRSGLDAHAADDAAHASVATVTAIVRDHALDPSRYELTVRSLVDGLFERLR